MRHDRADLDAPPAGSVFVVFARQPVAGQVKSRLAAGIGDEAAAEVYRAFVRDVLNSLAQSGARGVVAFTPDVPVARDEFMQLAPAEWRLWPQPEGVLGQRLRACFEQQFRDGVERVVIVGSDAPSLPREIYLEAAERLAGHDVVLGPAFDGGYYLIGLRRPADALASAAAWCTLFQGIDWGEPHVLSQTVAGVTAAGLSLALLPPWYDVDTVSDLQFLQAHLRALAAAGRPCPCPLTAAWLADREF